MLAALIAATAVSNASLGLTLQPAQHKLQGSARYRVAAGEDQLRFRLDPGLKVSKVVLEKKVVAFQREGDRLLVSLPAGRKAPATLEVTYGGRPLQRVADQTLQDVDGAGVLLAPGGAWFPEPAEGGPLQVSAVVRAPQGWRACGPAAHTAPEPGKLALKMDFAAQTRPAIAVAPYQVYNANGITCYMLGGPPGGSLAQGANLAGFYKERGIAVISPRTLAELPSGFAGTGTGSWLAAPRPTGQLSTWLASLAWQSRGGQATGPGQLWLTHGLVAYTQDLLTARTKGQAAYKQAMRNHLEAYEAFVRKAPAQDLPMGGAIAPNGPAWQPVVVDKGALLWGLVHDELGDKAFWEALAARHTALAKGDATLASFLALGGRKLDFVADWLDQPGLPRYRIEDVRVSGQPGAYQVSGVLAQPGGSFRTPLEAVLIEEGGVERLSFQAFGARVPFHFVSATRPLRLVIDPAERLPLARVQRLWINECLRRPDLLVVYGTHGDAAETAANRAAAEALARQLKCSQPVAADGAVTASQRRGPLALIGRPDSNALTSAWEDQLPVRYMGPTPGLWWQGRTFQGVHQGVLEAIANPESPDQPVVVLAGIAAGALADGTRFWDRQATFCVYDGQRVVEEGEALRAFPDLEAVLY